MMTPAEEAQIRAVAEEMQSDGCTMVTEYHKVCCYLHDIHYRTKADLDGTPVTRREADARFRRCMQERSMLGKMSPVSWIRWAAVRSFGMFAWKKGLNDD